MKGVGAHQYKAGKQGRVTRLSQRAPSSNRAIGSITRIETSRAALKATHSPKMRGK